MIPANGLLMVPEASAGCVCLFSIASTIVMEPREPRRDWTIYSSIGKSTPVKQLALNFGAPGDRRDARGTVWLAYPRPKAYKETGLVLPLQLETDFLEDGRYAGVTSNEQQPTDTESPWIYSYWAEGLTKCSIPLQEQGAEPASYTVKLHLADPSSNPQPGQRRFNVKLQGKTVLENVDLATAQTRAVIREFTGVTVTDNLVLELAPTEENAGPEQWPVLNGIEIVRE